MSRPIRGPGVPPGLPVLRFQRVTERKTVKNRLHLDIEVSSLDEAVTRIEALGGRSLRPRDTGYGVHYRVMADPEDNGFCLVERPTPTIR